MTLEVIETTDIEQVLLSTVGRFVLSGTDFTIIAPSISSEDLYSKINSEFNLTGLKFDIDNSGHHSVFGTYPTVIVAEVKSDITNSLLEESHKYSNIILITEDASELKRPVELGESNMTHKDVDHQLQLSVTVHDEQGKSFTRTWKETASRNDAIRWTIESEDLPYYVKIDKISNIDVKLVPKLKEE